MGKAFGRWAPLLGGAILAAGVILPLFGQSELAKAFLGVGAALGLTDMSPVSTGEIGQAVTQSLAAFALLAGIYRKLAKVAKPKG